MQERSMAVLKILGETPLKGEYTPQGAKNAVLPIMAASILIDGEIILHHVPNLTDVQSMCEILRHFQCRVKREDDTVIIDTRSLKQGNIDDKLMKTMRASNLIWGPLLSRFGAATIPMPGGCPIGARPMDIHIRGLKELGAKIHEHSGAFISTAKKLVGNEIYLDFPSVGATENLIAAGVKAYGTTVLRNVAKEPEVVDFCNFLIKAGAKIRGLGSDTLTIDGVKTLGSVEHTVVPDRIVAGTVLLATAMTKGDVFIKDIVPEHVESIVAKLHETGVEVEKTPSSLRLKHQGGMGCTNLKTLPYPGFPTDIQPQFMAALTLAKGTSLVRESIFENRYHHCNELKKMGADISVDGGLAVVNGSSGLYAAKVDVGDLRGGAALLMAAMAAKGQTVINNIHHIDRGYYHIENIFNQLGANILRE
ncbi:MAG: UDP-N-acetylglucosamine 1-carboxyvinyltransferase [Clostridiales bacterium]